MVEKQSGLNYLFIDLHAEYSVADFEAIEQQRNAARRDDEDDDERTRLTLQSRIESA